MWPQSASRSQVGNPDFHSCQMIRRCPKSSLPHAGWVGRKALHIPARQEIAHHQRVLVENNMGTCTSTPPHQAGAEQCAPPLPFWGGVGADLVEDQAFHHCSVVMELSSHSPCHSKGSNEAPPSQCSSGAGLAGKNKSPKQRSAKVEKITQTFIPIRHQWEDSVLTYLSAKSQDFSNIWNLITSCPKRPGFNHKGVIKSRAREIWVWMRKDN